MRFSVIVPTHDTRWLRECLDSVAAQSFADYEIVLVPNGDVLLGDLIGRPKVRVSRYTEQERQIGAIKRQGFMEARGEILVELDHDDLLTPPCLEVLDGKFRSGAQFVYSNTASFKDETWIPLTFPARFGWKHRPVQAFGHNLVEMLSFKPSPSSVIYCWWGANHVRAWDRELYRRLDGHNPQLPIADDVDLVIRTFLACGDWQKQFRHVDRMLYCQRYHGDSSSQGEIRSTATQLGNTIYDQNIQAVVQHWCQGLRLPCLDLGGAHGCPAGWQPVDRALTGVDLRGTWPWPDSSVGAFRASHILEHLPDRMHSMSEIHRCLVPGGWLLSETPSSPGIGADCDPSHVSRWNRRSFLYWTDRDCARLIGNSSIRYQKSRLLSYVVHGKHPWFSDPDIIPIVKFHGLAIKPGWSEPGEIHI